MQGVSMIKHKSKKIQLLLAGLLGGMLISACEVRNDSNVRNSSLFGDVPRSSAPASLREDRRSALTCLIEDDLALIAILYKIGNKSKYYVRSRLGKKIPEQLQSSVKKVVNRIYNNSSINKNTKTREVNSFLNRQFSQCLSVNGLDAFRRRMIRCRQFMNVITNINRRKRQGWPLSKVRRKFSVAIESIQVKQSIMAHIYNLKEPFYRYRFRVLASCASNVRK